MRRSLGLTVGVIAAPLAVQAAPELCHFDDPAPYFAALSAASAGSDVAIPECAPMRGGADAPEELALPMPCGHRLVFRRVDIPVNHILDQDAAFLGDSDAADGTLLNRLTSMPREDAISGSFFREQDGGRTSYYYIGKYELTAAQWRLFSAGLLDGDFRNLQPDHADCVGQAQWLTETGHSPVNMPPAVGLTWFDIIAFSEAYTRWLINLDNALIARERAPFLPWSSGSTGFVRPPTEVEWEYAARGGGASVSRESRRVALPQTRTDDGEIVTPALSQVAQTEPLEDGVVYVRGVGRLAPNLLGMHDVVGNASELVLDLFRPTRPDGLKGQVGGGVLRGGSTLTDDSLLSVGHRQEARLFGKEGLLRDNVAGVRMAISAPFFVDGVDRERRYETGRANTAFFDEADAAFRALATRAGDVEAEERTALAALRQQAAAEGLNAETQQALQDAMQIVDQTLAQQAQAARNQLRQQYLTAAGLGVAMNRIERQLWEVHSRLKNFADRRASMSAEEWLRRVQSWPREKQIIAGWEAEVRAIFNTYVETLASIAERPEKDRAAAYREAAERLDLLGSKVIGDFLVAVGEHLSLMGDQTSPTSDVTNKWLEDIDTSAGERASILADLERRLVE